jgi:hypothetical protein
MVHIAVMQGELFRFFSIHKKVDIEDIVTVHGQ